MLKRKEKQRNMGRNV